MDTQELETILTQRDLAAAERARDHVGPHAVFLANRYWRTQDWVERSLVVHMVQDQRGPHLRSLFSDFLHAPEPPAPYRDHVELTKAVCLVQLRGDLGLFARYEQDRALLRRDIQAELADEAQPPSATAHVSSTPAASSAPAAVSSAPAAVSSAPAPRLLGKPTPIAPPPERPRNPLAHQPAAVAASGHAGSNNTNAATPLTSGARTVVLIAVFFLVVVFAAGLFMSFQLQPTSPAPPVPATSP